MRSGKYYRTNEEGDRYIYILVRNCSMHSPPSTPLSSPRRGKNSPPTPPEDDMAIHMKLPTFKGVGDEDMDRFWFVARLVWTAKNVVKNAVKRAHLSLAFEGRALDWYMGYIDQHANTIIEENKNALKQKFKKPKSYSHIVKDLKDFKQGPYESIWEAD